MVPHILKFLGSVDAQSREDRSDDNARLIGENKMMAVRRRRSCLQTALNDGGGRRLGRYENAHTSSTGSIHTERKKAANRNVGGGAPVRHGRPGHRGVTCRPGAN